MPKETSKEDIRRNPLAVWVGRTIEFCQERKRIGLGILVALVVIARSRVQDTSGIRHAKSARPRLCRPRRRRPCGGKSREHQEIQRRRRRVFAEVVRRFPERVPRKNRWCALATCSTTAESMKTHCHFWQVPCHVWSRAVSYSGRNRKGICRGSKGRSSSCGEDPLGGGGDGER